MDAFDRFWQWVDKTPDSLRHFRRASPGGHGLAPEDRRNRGKVNEAAARVHFE